MSTVLTLLADAAKERTKLAKLEEAIAAESREQLTKLPAACGLETIDELIGALATFASPRLKASLKGVLGKARVRRASVPTASKPQRRKRAQIDDAKRAGVLDMLKAGGKTAAVIAAEFGISVSAVNGIKSAAKLTKARAV